MTQLEAVGERPNRVYQIRSPRSDWIEVDAQEFARIKDIKAFDWRVLVVVERCEKG